MKATVIASSVTTLAAASPETIWQKTHSMPQPYRIDKRTSKLDNPRHGFAVALHHSPDAPGDALRGPERPRAADRRRARRPRFPPGGRGHDLPHRPHPDRHAEDHGLRHVLGRGRV